jgi:hypothetical protein
MPLANACVSQGHIGIRVRQLLTSFIPSLVVLAARCLTRCMLFSSLDDQDVLAQV